MKRIAGNSLVFFVFLILLVNVKISLAQRCDSGAQEILYFGPDYTNRIESVCVGYASTLSMSVQIEWFYEEDEMGYPNSGQYLQPITVKKPDGTTVIILTDANITSYGNPESVHVFPAGFFNQIGSWTFNYNVFDLCSGYSSTASYQLKVVGFTSNSIGSNELICNGGGTPANVANAGLSSNSAYNLVWQNKVGAGSWANISGASSDSYSPPYINQTTLYRRIGTTTENSCQNISNEVTKTVYAAMAGGTIGSSQNSCYNVAPTQLSESVGSSGGTGSYSYKWNVSMDGTSYSEVSGATSITYSPPFVQGTRYYKRTTTDATCGSASSNAVTLVGYADLSAGTIGSAQTICYNATPSLLSVTSSASGGNSSFTYNWQLSSDGSSFSDISGATSTSYQPGSLTSSTWYRLAVINTCGTVYTASVKITVYADMSAGTIGSEETICYNTAPSSLSVGTPASGGSGSYTYQWQVSTDGSSYNNITGANLDSYQPAAITANRWYRMGVVNTCATVYTVGVKKTVYADLSAGTIGSAQTICYNTTPSEISVGTPASGGSGFYSYQWQSSTDGSSFSDITGQFNTTYQPGALTSDRWYRLEVFNTCGTVFTSSIKVTVRGQFSAGSISSDQSICNGTTPTIISVSTPASGGNGSYTYQWQSSTDGSSYGDVLGANATSYQPSTLTSSTWYKLKVTDLCGTLTTSSIKKTVYSTVSAGTITGEQTICYNTVPLQFNTNIAPSGGDGSFTYQWQISTDGSVFNDISGATLNSYQASALASSRWYRLKVLNLCSTVITNIIKVTVYDQFAPGAIGNDQSICYNTIPALLHMTTAASGGSTSYNYQWKYSDDGTNFYNVSGANSTSYQPSALTLSRWYKLEVTNSCEVKFTNTIKVTIYSQLSAGTTTGTQSICYNSTPTQLTVGTSPSGGSGVYTYQWEVSDNGSNWSSISGATGISYQPANLTTTTYYRRNVINVCSSDYANTLTVTVRANLVPGIINGGQTVCNNTAPTTFTTNVLPSGGIGTFTYQWQNSPNGSSWTNISGATSETYSASALTTTTYFRRAETSGTCGTVYTNSIQVLVNPLLVAGTVKSNETICYNTVPSMFITDTYPTGGTGSYSYQWQKLVASSWTNISGATGETYTSGALAETSYFRRLETSGSCGTVNTNQINIAVYAEFLPGVVGTNQTINYNTIPAEIEVIQAASGGTGVFTYQWQKSLDNSVWSNITDANGQNYQPTALTVNSYFKRLTASSTCGSKSANTVLITVYPQLVAGTVKSDQTICYNSAPSTFVTNTLPTGGTGFYNYQWQKLDGSTWTNISGATGDTYTTAALTETSYFRRAETSGTNPTVYTNTIQVTVRPQIVAGSIASDQTICYNSAPSLLQTNTYPTGGTGTFTYQWQKLVGSTWTNVSGATNESYSSGALSTTSYFRRLETSSTCGTVNSNQLTIQVYEQFVPGVIGSAQTINYNTVPAEIVTSQSPTGATGTYTFQWQKSIDNSTWTSITGATNQNYQPTALIASTYFKRLTASGACGTQPTNTILITVYPQLIAGSVKTDQTICYNTAPSMFLTNTLPSGGTGFYSYQWQKLISSTWTNISGATGENYTSGALIETSFFRRAETSGTNPAVYTNMLTVTIRPQIVAGSIKSDQTICYNSAPSLLQTNTYPSGGDGTFAYKWQKLVSSTWTDVSGATSESYNPGVLTATSSYRRVETNSSCGTVNTNQITVTVYNQLIAGVVGSAQTINYNTAPSELVSLSSPTGAAGTYTYQWQNSQDNSNWSNISGATAESYTPTVLTVKTYYKRLATSGSCGTLGSNVVTISVNPQLVAGTITADQTVCYNASPSELVTATLPSGGIGSYTYQWQKLVSSTWTNIAGANGENYSPSALIATTQFRRAEFSGTNPTVYTNSVMITVNPQLVAGSVKTDQTICYNTAPAILLNNTYPSGGIGAFTYQWQKLIGSTWTDISGATAENYTADPLTQTSYFRRSETSGLCGTVNTNQITINVYAQFIPGVIGSSQIISYNAVPSEIVTIQSPTGATGTYSYQWQKSIDNTVWSNITSATSENYQSTALTASTYFKRITTSGSCGSVSSNIILVTVNPQLIAGSIQQNQTICYNAAPSTFTTNTIPTGGTGYYSYQWQKLAGSTWTDISGASGETYTSGALTETSFFRRAETSGSSGTVFTNSVTITVNNALVAGTVKSDQVICYGAVPSILLTNTLTTGGAGNYSFQWQKLIGSSWTDISGATGESYLPDALNSSAIFRRVETSGTCGSVTSNQINITVYGQFMPGVIGSSQTINYNTAPSEIVSLQTPAGASGMYIYQWQKSIDNSTWSNITGANSETYQPPVITAKTYYKRQITSGSCGTIESNVVTISVNSQLTPGTVEGTQSICYSAVPSILNTSVSPSGGNGVYLYQWLKSEDGSSWIDVVAATNETYQPSSLTKTTYYKKRVTSESNVVYTNIVTVTVYEVLASGQIGVDQTVCYNTAPSSLYSVTQPSGGSGTYTNHWMASTNGTTFVDIAGAINGFYEPSALTTKTYYKKVVNNLCGVKESNVVAVSVYGVFSAGTIGANQTILYGSTPQRLEVSVLPTGGAGSFSYQWQSSTDNSTWTNISGATNSDYAPGSLSQTMYYKRLTTSGSCGTLETNVVVVTVTNEALVGSIGSDQAICYNTAPSLLTTISQPSVGTVVNSKIWQKSDDGLAWTDIVAAANDTYQPPSLTKTVYYRKKMVTASSGTIYTNIVTIAVNSEFSTGSIGVDQTVCNGYTSSPITTIVAPVGTSVQYLWQESLNNASWTDIAGATNDYYDAGTLTTTKYFRKKVMSSCGVGYTESVKITIGESLQGGIIESDQSVAFNTIPAKLIGSVAIGGSGAYVYQWYSSINSSDWQIVITGGVDKDYQPGALTQKTYFKRSVTSGACGIQYSNVVTVSVFDGLIPGVVSEAQSICYNSSPDLLTGTSPSGGSGQYSYQWQYSLQGTTWVDIIGEVGISYKPSSLSVNTYFRRVTISGNTQANSNFIMIRVYDQITLPVTSLKTSYCKNTRVSIDVVNPAYLSYKWYDANKSYLLDGSRYSVDNLTDSKTVYVRSVSSNGCLSDYLEQIITPDNLKANFTLDISQVNVGSSVRFTNSSVNANSYTWNFYDGDLIFEQNPTHYYNSTDGLDSKSFNVKLNVLSVNGCKDSLLVANAVTVINTLTGIDPNATIIPSYYPNPVNDNLTINCNSRITKIRVFSIIGNLLESLTPYTQNVTIPFSSKKSGVYIIEVTEANGVKSNLKVIKQ